MTRQHAIVVGQAVLLTAIIISFQNCSPVNFSALPDSTQLGSSAPPPTPTSTPPPVVGSVTCPYNGHEYQENESVVSFLTSAVPYGQSCRSETRVCRNGLMTGSYQYATCVAGAPQACLFNGQTIAHGASVTAYTAAQVAYGQVCGSQVRTCNNGVLSGSAAYSSCTVGAAPYVPPPVYSGPVCNIGRLASHYWECNGQTQSAPAGTGQCGCSSWNGNQGVNCSQVTITSPPYCTDGSTPQNSRVEHNTCSCVYVE